MMASTQSAQIAGPFTFILLNYIPNEACNKLILEQGNT